MEIAKINKLEVLPLSLQPYAINRIGKKAIKDLTEPEIKRNCYMIISVAFAESGQLKVVSAMLQYQSDTLFNELKGKFKDLTIDELKEAFKMGIRHEFGQYFGLCAKTYNQFIKGYFERPERAEAMRVYLDSINAVIVKELTPEEKRKLTIQGVYSAYESFCKSGELPFYSAPYYDIIKENGLVNWSKEERLEMELEAKSEYIGKLRDDKMKRKINSKQFTTICESLGSNQSFKNVCKKVALKRFFESCKLSNFKLELK